MYSYYNGGYFFPYWQGNWRSLYRHPYGIYGIDTVGVQEQQNYCYPSQNFPYYSNYRQKDFYTRKEVELMRDERSLWEEHVAWTRMAIISLVFNLPDLNFVLARLLKNAEDMGNMFRPIYGDEAATEYARLIKEHLLFAADLVKAAIAGDTKAAEEAERKWYQNADEIAVFLNSINPYLDKEEVRRMFYDHLRMTKQEAVYMITKDYEKDVAIYDDIEKQAREMADMISEAMIKLYPNLERWY